MDELVPLPTSGRVYTETHLPGVADYDRHGRARLDSIARWLQDMAYRDLVDSDSEQEGTWIVRRVRITAGPFPRFSERVEMKTWCSGLGRFSAERRTSISGADGGRIETVALWAFIDPVAGKPLRLDQEVAKVWGETAGERGAKVRLRHPGPPDGADESPWHFRATDLDLVDHVNNSNYWIPFEEDLQRVEEIQEIDAEIEFHEAAPAGEARVVRSPAGMWIAGPEPDGAVYASILVEHPEPPS
jgi:acyl-ACP thioesterase